jgi:LytTr DNA-binding domain
MPMQPEPRPYPKSWLAVGGAGFGLYFTLGLAYFETFGEIAAAGIVFFLPVGLILMLTALLLTFGLFGEPRPGKTARPPWMRWILLPIGAFCIAGTALYVYAMLCAPAGCGTAFLLQNIVIHMALLGLLPVQMALVLIPTRGAPQTSSTATMSVGGVGEVPQPMGMNGDSPQTEQLPTPSSMLVIEANGSEPQFKIPAADLIAVEAADNYCKFHHLKDGQRKTRTLRKTMKEAEEALQGMPGFYRCHRSFLVNGAWVEEVVGNSQAYRLKMQYMEDAVPVSRSFDVEQLRRVGE